MFKVGDKFVIELDRKFECNDCSYYKIKGLATTMNEAQLKALDHCDEADKKEEEAYKKGYAKAIEDIQKEQSEIRVGDEVKVIDFGCEAVVTCTDKHLKSVFVLYTDGSTDEFTDRTKLRKTGRHFDEIEKLIEILKGGEDSE